MASPALPQTPLTARSGALRTTLLLSLGLSPFACGGSVIISNDDEGSSARSGDGGATSADGGAAHGGPSEGGAYATGGAPPMGSCENPTFSPTTKLVSCTNGLRHRAEAIACTYEKPPPASDGGAGGEATADGTVGCISNSDCSAFLRGWCDSTRQARAVCRTGCVTDSDCEDGGACFCNGVTPGRCSYGGCRTDADCGTDGYCAAVPGGCGPDILRCITLRDECTTDADCQNKWACRLITGRHICVSTSVCGRPFLVAEAARSAALEERADWLDDSLAPNPSDLSAVERAELAAHWARLGQMEHASIAAFARFNLQLLSLGASSDLVEACNRALADETAHARMCFALARSYGGTAVGPARLDIEHCLEDTSLTAIAKLVLREGCLGETVASLEAAAAADVASEPAVRRALTRIAHDELNHAELAFRFLRWALAQSSAGARRELA